jgi:hypothetical protein
MRTRYQHGNLQLDKRRSGPDVWVYRWREYGPAGKVNRRGEMIGTLEQYPTKADALRACEHLQLTANSENPTSRAIAFGRSWIVTSQRKCQNVTLRTWRIGPTSKRTSDRSGRIGLCTS